MTSPNLDLVRSIYAASERGDFGLAEWAHPQIEFVVVDGPEPGSWVGKADMARAARERLSVWEGFRVEADEYRQLDDERVLVLIHRSARGKTSGMELAQIGSKGAQLFHICGGKVTRYVTWHNRDRAFADLGLEESVVSEDSTTPDLEEAIRRSMQALSRRDYDGALAPFSVHGVVDTTAAGALEVFEGRKAIREFLEVWRGPYEDFELELEEFHDHGNGVTLSVIAQRGRPPGSSSFVSVRAGHVAVWRDGLIERNTVFLDIDQARAAAERLAQERG